MNPALRDIKGEMIDNWRNSNNWLDAFDPNRTLPPETLLIRSKTFPPTRPCWGKPYYGKCSKGICSCLDGLEVEDLFNEVSNILT